MSTNHLPLRPRRILSTSGLLVDAYLCSPWYEYAGEPDRAWLVLAGKPRPAICDGLFIGQYRLISASRDEVDMLERAIGFTMRLTPDFPGDRVFEVVAQTIDGRVGVIRGGAGPYVRCRRRLYLKAAARARWEEFFEARHGAMCLAMVKHAEQHSFWAQQQARDEALMSR